ncbi:MAG: helix-turn-helix transcriptional regulator [Eubacteriales bacterium]|nr:helix-turn-helix transcriptional regulator [Eubacteriales bacterium]
MAKMEKDVNSTKLMQMILSDPEAYIQKLADGEESEDKISLREHLAALLEKKNASYTKLIQLTLLSKSYVYQIKAGEKKPSRDALLRIALALNLTMNETQRLLKIGQVGALYPKVRRDAAIICCIKTGQDCMGTDSFLQQIDEAPLL